MIRKLLLTAVALWCALPSGAAAQSMPDLLVHPDLAKVPEQAYFRGINGQPDEQVVAFFAAICVQNRLDFATVTRALAANGYVRILDVEGTGQQVWASPKGLPMLMVRPGHTALAQCLAFLKEPLSKVRDLGPLLRQKISGKVQPVDLGPILHILAPEGSRTGRRMWTLEGYGKYAIFQSAVAEHAVLDLIRSD